MVEALAALVLGTLGASLNVAPLKEISWASEMKTRFVYVLAWSPRNRSDRCMFARSMEEMNSRLGFADWGAQAKANAKPKES